MSNVSNAQGDSAKAGQDVEKTPNEAMEFGQQLGRFVARFVSGPIEQASGIVEDKLKYLRWERQARLMNRTEGFMNELGLRGPTRAVPLKIAIPLFQGGSLEEDDGLQDLWAKLLVNAGDAASEVKVERVFLDILENIGTLEARMLQTIYALSYEDMKLKGVLTKNLPNSVMYRPENTKYLAIKPPSADVEVALANLVRLGCLSAPRTRAGAEAFAIVSPTLLGKAFVDACTLRRFTR